MMYTIKRVGIGSAFRMGAVASALIWGILGLLFILWMMMIGNSLDTTATVVYGTNTNDFSEFTGGAGILIYLCGLPMYAIVGGITGAFYAFIYNLVSRWVGGLELELEQAQTPYSQEFNPPQVPQKRRYDDFDPFE